MEPFPQAQWPSWAYSQLDPFSSYNQMPSYPTYLADSIEAAYQSHQQHLVHHHQMSRTTESKPRLSKEEVETLEAEFQKNHKPNSSTKKALAEAMRVDNARINNWFQNRRAREKKENNIRAYEARQKLEKEKTDVDVGSGSDDERQRDLVASSAPFPDSLRPSRQATMSSETSPESSMSDTHSETGFEGDDGCVTSPQTSIAAQQIDDLSASDSDEIQTKMNGQANANSERLADYLAIPESMPATQATDVSLQSFESFIPLEPKSAGFLLDSYPNLMGSDTTGELSPSFPSSTFSDGQTFLDGALMLQQPSFHDSREQDEEFSPGASVDADMPLKSPPAMDIAGRRNRRPPPLSINGARSFPSTAPKTAIDLSKRSQFGNSMRRVASVSGTVRIVKPSVAPPRSPFTERKAESLLQLNRSPELSGPHGTIAPPTPNTPVVSSQQSVDEAMATATFPPNDKSYVGVLSQDPTLRTPPTTPGIMDQLFNLNTAYDLSLSDEPLATPGLGRFPGEFELPNMPTTVPSYIQDCASQPETPLYAPHMGPAYFGFAGGNTEYNWSEVSSSAKSSPGQNPQRVQFMNMTASNFS